MNKQQTNRSPIILTLILTLAFWGLFSMVGCSNSEQEKDLNSEETSISHMLYSTSKDLKQHVFLEERLDEKGKPYLVGVLDDKLNGALKDLVDAYNADPTTESIVTREEVRFDLTEGLTELCKSENAFSSTMEFLSWCGAPAEIEYDRTLVADDGSVVQTEGVSANLGRWITNFNFVTSPIDYPYRRYIWVE